VHFPHHFSKECLYVSQPGLVGWFLLFLRSNSLNTTETSPLNRVGSLHINRPYWSTQLLVDPLCTALFLRQTSVNLPTRSRALDLCTTTCYLIQIWLVFLNNKNFKTFCQLERYPQLKGQLNSCHF